MPNVQGILNDLDSRLPPEYVSGKKLRSNATPSKPLGLLAQPIGAKNQIFGGASLHGVMLIKKFLYSESEFDAKSIEAKYNKQYLYRYPKIDTVTSSNGVDDRPLFILHIGPGKTGSSTLQAELEQYGELLKEDNFYYIGIFPLRLGGSMQKGEFSTEKAIQMFRCFQDDRLFCEKNTIVEQLRQLLANHQAEGHNVIFSFENWSALPTHELTEFKWAILKEILSSFRVKVVITYRRYYSWLPSLFNQYFKQNYVQIDTGVRGNDWPDGGGLVIPSFAESFDENMNAIEPHLANYFHPRQDPLRAKEKWEEQFPGVSVLNMHDDGDLTNNFICKILPGATRACQAEKPLAEWSESELRLLRNPSVKLHYDMIATAAHIRGWVNDGLTRQEVRDAIQCRWQEMKVSEDEYLTCPSGSQYEEIVARSKDYEKLMVPEFSETPGAISSFEKEFRENVEKKKYCSVDPNLVLDDEGLNWLNFFRKLKPLDDGSGLNSKYALCEEGGRKTNTIIMRERLLGKENSRLGEIARLNGGNAAHYDLTNGNFLWTKSKD
uniref:Sulfotransferase domain-containing protein n=1 Tax=Leptocylindrus danicus TaxID=163516 RepID=A0A7S2P0T1_9STRA|eukprot:CAMPEP_0116039766 /NCGR_PEP_ID=MMETSP0321-20121206/23851_1 /TAXON_ID=163516 /ORGANISM="Leptocylindrus danicus var. danicus, Strain B650" /LENGTH=549 /DNA_ID=CAMNT_0003519237 /DNA_START=230 /DNA_END=1879 /DNA_ORIENTATION=-